jgi:regulator of RNase E activity RraA
MMSLGFRVLTCETRADPNVLKGFEAVPTAIISDNLGRMVAAGPRLRPLHRGKRLLGTAVTAKTRPGDNLMVHKAVDVAMPGDVIVVDGGGDLTNALIGELIIMHARSRGVVGFVVDAAARDLDFIANGDFPVYAAGVTHRGPYKDGPGEVNVPIAIDGMLIEPGDVIVGDLDGHVSIPRLEAASVLENAQRQLAAERSALEAIKVGGWDRSWIDASLRAKGCAGI